MSDADDINDLYDGAWLEVERDRERERAERPREPDDAAHRQAVEQAMALNEERRRRPVIDDERWPSGPALADAGKGAAERDVPESTPTTSKPDRSFPADIDNRYYIREDRNGDQRIFADSKGTLEIFQASGDRLRTKLDNEHAVKLMLDTAAHRGWASVTVKGAKAFRREAWLEGQARGIVVTGYKPNELDLQELKQREQAHLRNEIAPVAEDDHDRGERIADAGGQPRTRGRAFDYKQGIEGVLVEKGSRPYGDDDSNAPSPYVVLQDEHDRQHIVWGVGIPDALLKAGVQEGDYIRLRETGMERVTKPVLREIDGKLTRVNQQVNRRAWEAQVVREKEIAREHADVQANERAASDRDERETEIEAVERTVVGAKKTLHVGPRRDAALDDGGYANEHRAREYMENSRAAVAKNPELRSAATIEAYVERKLRAQFPGDPTAVSRGVAAARTKISQVIARGQDFPTPRVIETRELDRASREQYASDRDTDRPREKNHEFERDRDREHIREIDRGR